MNFIKLFLVVGVLLVGVFFAGDKLITTTNIASVIGSQQKIIFSDCISSFSNLPLSSFIITQTHLNDDEGPDAFVQYKEGNACGSAGCIYEICVSDQTRSYIHIPFGYAAKEITAEETKTHGMKDLMLNGDKKLKMTWDGHTYTLSTN